MFRIPSFHQIEMPYEQAVGLISARANGNLLQGLEDMNDLWMRHATGNSPYADDDEFFENWYYECNAYNVVWENMAPLFVEAA